MELCWKSWDTNGCRWRCGDLSEEDFRKINSLWRVAISKLDGISGSQQALVHFSESSHSVKMQNYQRNEHQSTPASQNPVYWIKSPVYIPVTTCARSTSIFKFHYRAKVHTETRCCFFFAVVMFWPNVALFCSVSTAWDVLTRALTVQLPLIFWHLTGLAGRPTGMGRFLLFSPRDSLAAGLRAAVAAFFCVFLVVFILILSLRIASDCSILATRLDAGERLD